MNAKLSFSSVAMALLLSACGGGSGGGGAVSVEPVFASGPPPADLGDLVGHVFPVHLAEISTDDGGTSFATNRETLSLEFTSDTTAILTTPNGQIELTDSGSHFTATADGVNYAFQFTMSGMEYLSPFVFMATDTSDYNFVSVGLLGFETPLEVVDANNGGAFYGGDSVILLAVEGQPLESLEGTSQLHADFAGSAVNGTVFQNADMTLNLDSAPIVGNSFSGPLEVIVAPAGFEVANSDLDGRFYGIDSNHTGGTFEGSGSNLGAPMTFTGMFFGD